MTSAREFEAYFDDPDIPEQHLTQLQRVRQFVHEIYPDITERVAYAMPGFYPVEGKKATETLLFVMAQKIGWASTRCQNLMRPIKIF